METHEGNKARNRLDYLDQRAECDDSKKFLAQQNSIPRLSTKTVLHTYFASASRCFFTSALYSAIKASLSPLIVLVQVNYQIY